jgi:hypothetical protein
VSSTYLQSYSQHIFSVGTAASPSITFAGDTDSGFWRSGSDAVGLSLGGVSRWLYGTATDTRAASADEYAQEWTNYNAAAAHNTLTLRAARGTLASPDYLADNDILGKIKWEARDGAGTWQDGAEIRAQATGAHSAGVTPTEIEMYTTTALEGEQELTAKISQVIAMPGALNIPCAGIDTRMMYFGLPGTTLALGYFGDIGTTVGYDWEGVVLFDFAGGSARAACMLGSDGFVYHTNGENNVGDEGSWRQGMNGSGDFVTEIYEAVAEGEGEPELTWVTKHTVTP